MAYLTSVVIKKMVVNEMKTRVMVCWSSTDNVKMKFNNKILDVVDQYKYLGNIIKRRKGPTKTYLVRTIDTCAIKRSEPFLQFTKD